MMFVTYVMARHTVPAEQTFTLTQVFVTLYRGFLSLLAPVIILGGIYLGVFTPTESAVIAVVYGIIVGFVYSGIDPSRHRGSDTVDGGYDRHAGDHLGGGGELFLRPHPERHHPEYRAGDHRRLDGALHRP